MNKISNKNISFDCNLLLTESKFRKEIRFTKLIFGIGVDN
jgi:hypothetical protein